MIRFVEFRDVEIGGGWLYAVDALNAFLRCNEITSEIMQVQYQKGSILLQLEVKYRKELKEPTNYLSRCVLGLLGQEELKNE